jgi:hypothetical protein
VMENERLANTSSRAKAGEARIMRLVVSAAFIGLFLLVFWLAMKSQRMAVPNAPLVIEHQYLSFGEVWEQRDFQWVIAVENRNDSETTVHHFSSSCDCLSVEPSSLLIPPKGKVNLTLKIDLTKASSTRTIDGMQGLCVRVVPVLENEIQPAGGWTFCGKIKRQATFMPREVHVWAGLYHGRSDVHRKVDVLLHVPARNVEAISDSCYLSSNLKKQESNKYQLDLALSSLAPEGAFEHTVQLKIIGEDGLEKPAPKLKVKGAVLGQVEAVPSYAYFGVSEVGATLSQNIHLKGASKTGLRLIKIDNPCPDSSVVEAQSDSGGILCKIVQRVTQSGLQSYILRFHIESTGSMRREFLVPIKVNYYGFTPEKG